MELLFSTSLQYAVSVPRYLLLIYNSTSVDSSNVCAYYLANRPMVSNANVLAIACTNVPLSQPGGVTSR